MLRATRPIQRFSTGLYPTVLFGISGPLDIDRWFGCLGRVVLGRSCSNLHFTHPQIDFMKLPPGSLQVAEAVVCRCLRSSRFFCHFLFKARNRSLDIGPHHARSVDIHKSSYIPKNRPKHTQTLFQRCPTSGALRLLVALLYFLRALGR